MRTTQEIISLAEPIYGRSSYRYNLNRRPSPYILFTSLNRPQIIQNFSPHSEWLQTLKEAGFDVRGDKGGFSFEELGYILGYIWKNISEEERLTYIQASHFFNTN